MAEKFGVCEEEFSILETTNGNGESRFTATYTAAKGIYKGSWSQIFAKREDKEFKVDVNGKKIDTRKAMNWDLYKALIINAKVIGVTPLPDSYGQGVNTRTWLTGEEAFPRTALCGCHNDGHTFTILRGHSVGTRSIRFRPAVVI